ncbi:MAG TPA: restriction endonuclease [Actinomycetota bacterium]|nr:restriction endonuclease [Actinomycetota bacterium]
MAEVGSQKRFWVVRAGDGGKYIGEFEAGGFVAIGFHAGDVSGMSRKEIQNHLQDVNPGKKERVAGDAGMLYRFANVLQVGDMVVTPDGATRELLFGEIIGPYRYEDEPVVSHFRQVRPVRWIARHPRDLLPKRVLYSLGSVLTVFRPKGQDLLQALLEGRLLAKADEAVGDASEEGDVGDEDLFADLQARSDELIRSRLSELDGYQMQDVVAGILRAMGYYTQISPPGADQGVDIVASRDPLGVERAVKVQVKARPTTRSGASEIRELAGVLDPGGKGIFVSSGGFTREALADPSAQRVTFVDGERLQELLVEYYDRLSQDVKALVPLRSLYFPAS